MKQGIVKGRMAGMLMLAMTVVLLMGQSVAWAESIPPTPFPGVTARIPVQQTFSTNVSGVEDIFTYVLESATADAPMPAGSRDGQYAFTMEGNVAQELKIEAYAPGQYRYRLYQSVAEQRAHYRYDRAVYEVTVYVYMDGENQASVAVVIQAGDEGKVSSAAFHNRYSENKPTTPPGDGGGIQTGDENELLLYLALMVFAGTGLVLLLIWVRKKDNDQEGDATYEK